MDALDEKHRMAVAALHREAKLRKMSVKELFVRIMSDSGKLNIPLWNRDFDAMLKARSASNRDKAWVDIHA